MSQLRERIKDNVRERQSPSGAERRKQSVPILDVPVVPFQPERQKGSIREVTPEFGFQPERRKINEPEFGFGEQLRETINELQPQKGSIREVTPFIEEPSEFFDIERESQPLLIRQQDYDVDDDNQPLQYIPPYAEGDEQDEPEEEKQSLFSRAKKSIFGFLNDAIEPEVKIPRSFRQKEEMKEEMAEEDVGETKDDLPPAFSGVSRTESLVVNGQSVNCFFVC